MTGNRSNWPPYDGPPMRDVVEGPTYAAQRDSLGLNIVRLDDILEDLIYSIATNPESYPLILVRDMYVRRAVTDAKGAVPGLRIFFMANDRQVKLLWIQEAP